MQNLLCTEICLNGIAEFLNDEWNPHGSLILALYLLILMLFQGIRRRRMTCIRKSDHVVVSDQRCELLPPVPSVFEECNTECELR